MNNNHPRKKSWALLLRPAGVCPWHYCSQPTGLPVDSCRWGIQTEPARSRSTMPCRISINKLSLQSSTAGLACVHIQTNNNLLTYWITEPFNSNLFYNNLLICILQQRWLIPYYILSYYISPSPWKIVPVYETKSITLKQHWTWKNYPKIPPE